MNHAIMLLELLQKLNIKNIMIILRKQKEAMSLAPGWIVIW